MQLIRPVSAPALKSGVRSVFVAMVCLTLVTAALALANQCWALRRIPRASLRLGGRAVATHNDTGDNLLEVIQAATPPRDSFDGYSCKQTLFAHDFANSYGTPYVGFYTPPPDNCSFTTTIFNLSVSSRGRQYDRLAQLFFGDVEIWRTSTAMPTETGIHWSFQKDMSIFDALLREEQKIIFDLGNVVDGNLYTGIFNVTLDALYFDDNYSTGFHPAEHIYPISNLSSAENKSSVFSLPDDSGAVTLSLPRNIKTAVVSLLASGNSAEEFWYSNVPTAWLDTFGADARAEGLLYGYSPWREVQLRLDGQLAGVAWPFPILFTGGVDPGLWRPVVGVDAFDLPSFEIDVTPWLSLLCDGEAHTFQIQVVGFDSRASAPDQMGTVGQNWWVSGTVFLWLDDTTNQTVAGPVTSHIAPPVFDYLPQLSTSITNGSVITNDSLWVSLSAQRSLSISSSVIIANETKAVSWVQNLSFSNILNMSNGALNASLTMQSSGNYSGSVSQGQASAYAYPLSLYYSYDLAADDSELSSVFALIDRSLVTSGIATLSYLTGTSVGREDVATRQNVSSSYYWNTTIVGGMEELDKSEGGTWYSSLSAPGSDSGVAEFSRYVTEKNDEIVTDQESWVTMAVPTTEPLPFVE